MVVILLGAAGAGKTTVGRALAEQFSWRFVDADDLHTPGAIAKIRSGVPLTDVDRAPWLAALHGIVATALERREPLVLACSALKQRYRDTLRGTLRTVRFVYLEASEATLAERLAHRRGHFAGPSLLATQLAALEAPADALAIDATLPPDRIVDTIANEFGL